MKHEVMAREVRVHVTDAPPVSGVTAGLHDRTVEPRKVNFVALPGEFVYAECTGPTVRDGVVGTAYFTVKVSLSPGSHYPDAPQWVREVWAEVQS